MANTHYKATLLHYTIEDGYTQNWTSFRSGTLQGAKIQASQWANKLICHLQPFRKIWIQCEDKTTGEPINQWRKSGNPESPESPNLFLETIENILWGHISDELYQVQNDIVDVINLGPSTRWGEENADASEINQWEIDNIYKYLISAEVAIKVAKAQLKPYTTKYKENT